MLRRQRAASRPAALSPEGSAARRILIVSASMGAGHDGAARELAQRLESRGHHTETRDFLDAGPLRLGTALRSGYQFELRHVPSAYDATYRFWHKVPWLAPLVAWFVTLLTRRRMLRWVSGSAADVVVSTYPLATLCLGRLRATQRLAIPAINFITDFGVHPLWVHKGMDLNLAVQADPAEVAQRQTGKPGVACGPMVADRFDPAVAAIPQRRREARERLGLAADDLAVLIVAGSWGIGGLHDTFDSVLRTPGAVPVVVCGHDERLVGRMRGASEAAGVKAVILGWTDEMPALMAGSDALVENAGGLTAFEAMRIGLPVVSYRPIAGHGRENTAAMARAGVSRVAAGPDELASMLGEVGRPGARRDQQIRAARSMFVSDGARGVLDAIPPILQPAHRGRRPRVIAYRLAAGMVATASLTWAGLTTGVGVAAAIGTGVAHPAPGAGQVVYVGYRLNTAELSDPTTAAAVGASGATVVLDDQVASAAAGDAQRLADEGVDIASGGQGHRTDPRGRPIRPQLWTRAQGDVNAASTLGGLVGRPVTVFVPGRRVNAFDMVDTGRAHERLVVPNTVIDVNDRYATSDAARIRPRSVILVNGLHGSPTEVGAYLDRLSAILRRSGLTVLPLDALH